MTDYEKALDFVQKYAGQKVQWNAPDGDVWLGIIIGMSPVHGCIRFKADPEYHIYEEENYHIDFPRAFRVIDNIPLPLPG